MVKKSKAVKPKTDVQKKTNMTPNEVIDLLKMLDHYRFVENDPSKAAKIEAQLNELRHFYEEEATISLNNESYIPYPEYSDRDFFKKIISKKEFNKSLYDPIDASRTFEHHVQQRCDASDFRLTKNQVFLKNFMSPFTPYNGLLLFHGVGTGKSCGAISIAEQFIDFFDKKILVLMPTNLKDNFRKQIFDINKVNQCTGKRYLEQVPDRDSLTKQVIERRVNRVINDRYQFMGFLEFANYVGKIEQSVRDKNEGKIALKIQEVFSNRVIIIDEVHNVRDNEDTGKIVPPKLMRMLKYAQNTKLILLTATPMFNEASEIIWLLNMLLANDKRPLLNHEDLFDKEGLLTDHGSMLLSNACKGYVSYMRGENPFSFPIRLLPSINDDKNLIKEFPSKDIKGKKIPQKQRLKNLEIIGSAMGNYQRKLYESAESNVSEDVEDDDDNGEDEKQNKKMSTSVLVQTSNIVYPSLFKNAPLRQCYGSDGFNNCFDESKEGKSYKVKYKKDVSALHGEFLRADMIEKFAPKLKRIIDYIMNSDGIIYVYSFYLKSGIIPLAIALEHMGFAKYNGHNILSSTSKVKPFMINGKQATYSLLTPKKEMTPDFDGEIEAIKSEANKNGEMIKVILGSSVTSEGIDFKRIREIHLLEPWFHLNKVEQIVGRGARNCSHIDLDPSKRNVTVYHHAAYIEGRENETIDLRIYRIAENKQSNIDQVEQLLKENAIDCHFNKHAIHFDPKYLKMKIDMMTSQKKKLKDYVIGDKKSQDYKCIADIKEGNVKIDGSTFQESFYHDEIELYAKYVKKLFEKKHGYSLEEIEIELNKTYSSIDSDVLKFTLEYMLNTKYEIMQNDSKGYMIYRGNRYLFQPLDINDTRITNNQRATYSKMLLKRIKIDAKLDDIENQKRSKKKKTPIKQRDDDNDYDNDDTDNATLSLQSFENHMKETIDRDFGITPEIVDRLFSQIVDYTIDRLSESQLLSLCFDVMVNKNDAKSDLYKHVSRSLSEGHILVDKAWVRNLFSNEVYVLNEGKTELKKASPKQLTTFNGLSNSKVEPKVRFRELKGFIEQKDDHGITTFKFKYIDPSKAKSEGSVCDKDSKMYIDTLKQNIKHVESEIGLTNKKKPILCNIYELILRSLKPQVFARPYEASIIVAKHKADTFKSLKS